MIDNELLADRTDRTSEKVGNQKKRIKIDTFDPQLFEKHTQELGEFIFLGGSTDPRLVDWRSTFIDTFSGDTRPFIDPMAENWTDASVPLETIAQKESAFAVYFLTGMSKQESSNVANGGLGTLMEIMMRLSQAVVSKQKLIFGFDKEYAASLKSPFDELFNRILTYVRDFAEKNPDLIEFTGEKSVAEFAKQAEVFFNKEVVKDNSNLEGSEQIEKINQYYGLLTKTLEEEGSVLQFTNIDCNAKDIIGTIEHIRKTLDLITLASKGEMASGEALLKIPVIEFIPFNEALFRQNSNNEFDKSDVTNLRRMFFIVENQFREIADQVARQKVVTGIEGVQIVRNTDEAANKEEPFSSVERIKGRAVFAENIQKLLTYIDTYSDTMELVRTQDFETKVEFLVDLIKNAVIDSRGEEAEGVRNTLDKFLDPHLNEVTAKVGKWMPFADVLLKNVSQEQRYILEHVIAPLHDYFKLLGTPEMQYMADHQDIAKVIVELVADVLDLGQQNTRYLSHLISHHENIFNEQQWKVNEKQNPAMFESQRFFFVADVFTGVFKISELTNTVTLDLDNFNKRFVDLAFRHLGKPAGKVFRPEWIASTLQEITSFLDLLKSDGFKLEQSIESTLDRGAKEVLLNALNSNDFTDEQLDRMYEAWKLFYPAKTSEYNKHYFKENQKLVRILKKESIDVPDRLLTARFKGSLLANRMLEKLVLKHQAKAA